ncbi:MAG: hypothetical protein K0S74_955 [Chlamydiales bacterium]|jgi:hypothetical protein|nr:hypothetical protein [Chlamydiales bacterium]
MSEPFSRYMPPKRSNSNAFLYILVGLGLTLAICIIILAYYSDKALSHADFKRDLPNAKKLETISGNSQFDSTFKLTLYNLKGQVIKERILQESEYTNFMKVITNAETPPTVPQKENPSFEMPPLAKIEGYVTVTETNQHVLLQEIEILTAELFRIRSFKGDKIPDKWVYFVFPHLDQQPFFTSN